MRLCVHECGGGCVCVCVRVGEGVFVRVCGVKGAVQFNECHFV